ncbi:MAG TPA: DUF2079 domain-containing protein, partial [Ktedonobacterales bacterium]
TRAGQRRLSWMLVGVLIVVFLLVVGQRALVAHLSYHSEAFDLGNMDQAVWNTLHGRPFRFTNRGFDWFGPPTRLGIHVEPILVLIAPLYLIHAGAETLIVLQALALALGALPLMALALRRLPELPLLGVVLVAAYLATPEILGEALWGFHAVTLATPLLLCAFLALDARRYGWFVLVGVLAAATKEDVALALVPLGLLIALRRGRPRLGLAVALSAMVWTALCFLVIIPHFNGGASAAGSAYWYRYTRLGSSPGAALANLVTHPWLLLAVVVTPDKLAYLAVLARTGGGLGIFAPFWWLVGAPELAVNLLSAQTAQYSGFYQYNAMLLPVALAATVYGVAHLRAARVSARTSGRQVRLPSSAATPPPVLAALNRQIDRLNQWWSRQLARIPVAPRWMTAGIVVWLLVATVWNLAAVWPRAYGFWDAGAGPAPHQAQIASLLQRIPANATVAATDTLDPHLTDRTTIYLMPDPQSYQAQYVAAEFNGAAASERDADLRMWTAMLDSGRYRIVGVAGTVVVLERVGPPLVAP